MLQFHDLKIFSKCSSGLQNYFKPSLYLFLIANLPQRPELQAKKASLGQQCFEFQAEGN